MVKLLCYFGKLTLTKEINMTQWFHRHGSQYTGPVHSVDAQKGRALYTTRKTCYRCGGAGGSDKWKFTGWTCFECGGGGHLGMTNVKVYTQEKLDKLNAIQAKAAQKRIAKRQEEQAVRDAEKAERSAKWRSENPDVVAAIDKFAYTRIDDFGDEYPNFFAKMREAMEKFGSLTDKQTAAVRKSAVDAEREARRKQSAKFVGAVGSRITLRLTVKRVIDLGENRWGHSYIVVCQDDEGNTIKYLGQKFPIREGEEATITATIKEHKMYRDEPQTVIQRPSIAA